jgi:hypothetical protein
VAYTVFVVGYPYLWPDPIGRTYLLFAFRAEEMARQLANWPSFAISSPVGAFQEIWSMLAEQYTVANRLTQIFPILEIVPSSLDLLFAIVGIGVLLWLVKHRGLNNAQALVGAILLGEVALIVIGLRVSYVRYYLPLVLVNSVMVGIVFGFAAGFVRSLARGSVRPLSRAHSVG